MADAAAAGGAATSEGPTRFIGGIDGLRALAVLSVLFYHLEASWIPGGFVGVDVFFVISGFVVAHSVYDSGKTSFTDYFTWFYRRRLSRIMPALFAYVLVLALVGMLLLPSSPATKLIDMTGVSAIVGASNLLLLWKSNGYFVAASEFNTFTHTWSLAVEEQYYLLFPFLSYFLIVRRQALPSARMVTLGLTWALCLGSLVAAWHFTAVWQDFAFYMLPTRFWELGLGLLLRCQLDGWSGRKGLPVSASLVSPASGLALLALIASFWLVPGHGFPFPGALLPCLATAALIVSVWLFPGSIADRLLSTAPLRFVGKISYSLYLWHWGVIVMMRWTTGLESLPLKLAALAAMFALAIGSYYWIEQPLRHSRPVRSASMLRFFGAFAAIGALVGAVTVSMALLRPVVGLSATNDRLVWDPYSLPEAAAADCSVSRQETGLQGGKEIVFTPQCGRGDLPQVFITGDSHGGAYERMAFELAAKARTPVRILSRGGCPLLDGAYLAPRPDCDAFRNAVLASVRSNARANDVLLVSALYTPRYRDEWGVPAAPPGPGVPTTIGQGAARAIAALAPFNRLGLRIVLEAPKPTLPTALFRCADAWTRINPYCDRKTDVLAAEQMLRRSKTLEMLTMAVAATPGAEIWDPFPVLCPGTTCRGYKDGKPLYFDTDHLTGYANTLLLPSFVKTIQSGSPASSRAAQDINPGKIN
jgi:peptidoglycan/LPS O-acetylase OafA/YrhL